MNHRFRLFSEALGAFLLAICPCLLGQEPPPPKSSDAPFSLSIEALHNEDVSDWTGALSWHVLFERRDVSEFPVSQSSFRFATDGMVAIDKELNNTPLTAELDLFADTLIGQEKVRREWERDRAAGMKGFIDPEAPNRFSAMLLEGGISARGESDQGFDNYNALVSAFVQLTNVNRGNAWSLVPTVRIAFDGVFDSDAVSAGETANTDPGGHTRLRGEAKWIIPLAWLGDGAFLDRSTVAFAGEAIKSFDTSGEYESEGLDESFGVWVEYRWMVDNGIRESGGYELPLEFYIRGTFGRFAPEPEDQTSIMVGLRLGLEGIWDRKLN